MDKQTEGNINIAIFRGSNHFPIKRDHSWGRLKEWKIPDLGSFDTEHLKYHSSWTWLMPVIEQISQHVYNEQEIDDGIEVKIIKNRAFPVTFGMICHEEGKFMFRFNRMGLHKGDTLIEAAFSAVVEWIEFDNKSKKNNL